MIRLYEEGASDVEVCKAIKMAYNEFDKRCKSDPSFSEIVDYGRLAAKSWWLELGREGAAGKNKINYSVWYAIMKNRFGWSDRVENVNGEGDKPTEQMGNDEIIAELARYKNTLAAHMKPSNVLLTQVEFDESYTSN